MQDQSAEVPFSLASWVTASTKASGVPPKVQDAAVIAKAARMLSAATRS